MSANRLQSSVFQLSALDYTIRHIESEENVADCLSCKPLEELIDQKHSECVDVNYLNYVIVNIDLPIKYEEVLEETKTDSQLN